MKKFICLFLAFVLVFSVAGCKKNEPAPSQPAATPPADIGGPVAQKPLIAVSMPVITEQFKAESGAVLCNYIYQEMSLFFADPEIADKVYINFLNRVDATRVIADQLYADANAAYSGPDFWTPYLCQYTYEPKRIDQSVLSMLGTYATYSGGARPEAVFLSLNYDLITGDVLSLSNILSEGASIDRLSDLVIAALDAQKEEKFLDDNFAETVKNNLSDGSGLYDAWYFTQSGLCFFFSPYEIAPYASGVIVAEIPYEKLTGIIKDDFFPAERDSATGTLLCQSFSVDNSEKFTKFAEIIADKDGEQSFIYTDKAIYDLRIERGTWSASGETFNPQHTILAAASLTPGDAVYIQAKLPEGKSDLRITYTTDSGTVSVFLQKGCKLS